MTKFYSYYFEETCFAFSFDYEQLAASPSWCVDDPFPPLPPRRAIEASRACLEQMLKGYQLPDPDFCACTLKQQSKYEGSKWYYVISWFVYPPELDSDRGSIDVPVLMNGECPPFKMYAYDDRLAAWSNKD
jgi:hypothetical protein